MGVSHTRRWEFSGVNNWAFLGAEIALTAQAPARPALNKYSG